MKKAIFRTLFFLSIFLFSFLVWYSPVVFKGQAPYKIKDSLVVAKNFKELGVFSFENKQNIFLAPSRIIQEAEISSVGNKFTTYLYAALFRATGVLSPGGLVIFSILLNSLALMIFAAVVYRLFGAKVTALFSLIYILLPFIWQQIYSIGTYEFALFFLSLFFLFFIFGRDAAWEKLWLFLAGFFLVLAALTREAFLPLILILFFYFWFFRRRQFIIPLFAPIILVIFIFYAPSFFSGETGNVYSKLFVSNTEQSRNFQDFSLYGHLYPDPYTFHFGRQDFLSEYKEKMESAGFVESLQMKKVLVNMGERSLSFYERFFSGLLLFAGHLGYFFSLEEMGGPFVLFFVVMGLLYLRQKNRDLFRLFIFWIAATIILLSFIVSVARPHLMDFSWVLPLLASLGIFYTIDIFNEKLNLSVKNNIIFSLFLIIIFLYGLFLANHVVFGKIYDGSLEKTEIYFNQIRSQEIKDSEVIAFGVDSQDAILLNYLSEKSIVIFNEETIKKLLEENKLKEAFDNFGIKYILAYDSRLSKKIVTSVDVIDLSANFVSTGEPEISPLKSFILNLIR